MRLTAQPQSVTTHERIADRDRHHRNLEGCQKVAGASKRSEDLRSASDAHQHPGPGVPESQWQGILAEDACSGHFSQ